MTATARIARSKAAILASVVTAVALANPNMVRASAGSPQLCEPGAECTIGEFLFDDDYVPITGGACTITSRYPDGSLFLNSQAMTGSSDGWYEHEFTTPATQGYYRSQICCTVGADYMCVDKSFESSDAAAGSSLTTDSIASAVWGYGSRSLTGFGNLVSDIWGHSSRNLTSFGNLIQDLWKHDPRSLTDGSSGDLAEIEKTVKENRLMLEKLVNKPIIQNFVEEEVPDLSQMLTGGRETALEMNLNAQLVVSRLGVVMLSWEQMTGEEIAAELAQLTAKTGRDQATDGADTLVGQARWFADQWQWSEAEGLVAQAEAVGAALAKVDRSLKGVGGWKAAYSEAKQALALAEKLESMVGSNADGQEMATIFGRLARASLLVQAWDDQQASVDQVLRKIKGGGGAAAQAEIDRLAEAVLAVNQVPEGQKVLRSGVDSEIVEKRITNRLLAMRGLIDMNRVFMAKGVDGAMAFTWLEEGSMVFKSVVTNPSVIIGQEVELKYYLPPEVKEEDILGTDEGLEVKYDAEKDQAFVEGKFLLKPGESKTLAVRVDDKWMITDEQIASLHKQAEELARPLEKTAFFAQSITIKSDIDVALDKIVALTASAVTPEQKIRSFREAQIEMGGVIVKMEKLKDLVTQSSSAGGLLGFVGGAQVMAVWGLIIILLAGFAFLALYMKTIAGGKVKTTKTKTTQAEHQEKPTVHHGGQGWKIGFTVVVAAVLSSTVSSAVVASLMMRGRTSTSEFEVRPLPEVAGAVSEVQPLSGEPLPVGGPEIARIALTGDGSRLNARQNPAGDAMIVFRLKETEEVEVLGREGSWVEILDAEGRSGWIAEEYVLEIQGLAR